MSTGGGRAQDGERGVCAYAHLTATALARAEADGRERKRVSERARLAGQAREGEHGQMCVHVSKPHLSFRTLPE